MDYTFAYMIALGVLVVASIWWSQKVKREDKDAELFGDRNNGSSKLGKDETSAPIEVLDVDRYENESISMTTPGHVRYSYSVRFRFIDQDGNIQKGYYTTKNYADVSSVHRVAYKVIDPQQYRVLGKIEGETKPVYLISPNIGFADVFIEAFLDWFLKKDFNHRIQVLLRMGIMVFSVLIGYNFFQAWIA